MKRTPQEVYNFYEHLNDAINTFDNFLKRKFPLSNEEKNIYNYKTLQQFWDVIDKYKYYESNTQKAKAAKAEGAP